jgi:hypothetical protein
MNAIGVTERSAVPLRLPANGDSYQNMKWLERRASVSTGAALWNMERGLIY